MSFNRHNNVWNCEKLTCQADIIYHTIRCMILYTRCMTCVLRFKILYTRYIIYNIIYL